MNATKKDPVILIIDDEPDILDLYEIELERRGFNTIPATNGEEALEVYTKNHIDLILTDFRMPNGNGLDVLRGVNNIAASRGEPPTPLIIITGFIEEGVVEAMQEGAAAVHSKPISFKEIAIEIGYILDLNSYNRNKRHYARRETEIKAKIEKTSDNEEMIADLANISMGGMQLTSDSPLLVNSVYNIILMDPDKKKPVHGFPIKANCLWQKKFKDNDGRFYIGLAFDEDTKKELLFVNLLRQI